MWQNRIRLANGSEVVRKHATSEGDAKAWNESLAKDINVYGKVVSVHLEHVADGPGESGKVTPIQTTYTR
jgi:hypothetical protein